MPGRPFCSTGADFRSAVAPPKPGFAFRISGHPVAPTVRPYRRTLTVRFRRGKVKVCIKCKKCNFKLSSCQTLCIVCCETVSHFYWSEVLELIRARLLPVRVLQHVLPENCGTMGVG